MPTYEYQCTRCGHVCEEFKPISAPKRQRCPECRGKVERLISGGLGVHFKGSGFYVNDSKTKKSASDKAAAPAKTDKGSGSGD
jgi:putative FmdB family regulatory protein